jgi:hypothetical protein
VACSSSPKPTRSAADTLEARPETFVARVSRLRQLRELRPTPVLFDDEETFQRVADRKAEREAIAPTPIDVPAVQLALGLLFAAKGAAPAQSFGALHRSQMLAFYDEFRHEVHVRARAKGDSELPSVVAHELGHSLQFQHFRVPDIASVIDEDARLARLALVEGDAMLVMAAFASEENHLPLSRVLVRMAEGAMQASLRGYQAALEQSPELAKSPPFQRDRLVFPYQAGGSFVAQIHRAGGFSLVNRLYESPPATTEQILHPEKYLAGELAVPVRAPEAPPGWQTLRSGHVGELLVRAMLDVCNERRDSLRAAMGWGGDAFTVVRQGEQGALLLVTAWDSEADAQEFERAMRATAACWDRAPAATREIFRGVAQVRRTGTSVGVVRGFPAQKARQLLAGLTELVGPRLIARPPFGRIDIPPVRRAEPPARPAVRGGHVVAPRMGLVIPIPPGMKPSIDEDDVSFSATGGGFASLIFAVSDLAFSPSAVCHSFDVFEAALRRPLSADQTLSVVVARGSVETPLGRATERVWQIDGTPVHGRLLLIPICRDTGMLVIGQGYASAETREALDRAIERVKSLPEGSPICAELDP